MSKFQPMLLAVAPNRAGSYVKTTISTTIKGDAAEEFDKMVEKTGLTKSQLALQMIHHCLDKTQDLKNLYRRLAILANDK